MSRKLTAEDFIEASTNDAQKVTFYGFAVMIATALAFALLSALAIAKGLMDGGNRVDYLVRIPFWCVSALAVGMVYMKLHTYGKFITHTITVFDVLIPLSKALTASALFAVLCYDDPRTWHLWPLAFSMFALVSHLKIHYYHSKFDETNAPLETAELLRMINENMRETDLRATAIFGLLFLVAWVLLNFVPPLKFMAHWSSNWQVWLAIPAGFAMVMAIQSDVEIRRKIAQLTEAKGDNIPT
jgi:hypothetical protein